MLRGQVKMTGVASAGALFDARHDRGQVGEGVQELVELEEPLRAGVEAAGAHVVGCRAGVDAPGGVAVGVERGGGAGVALGQGGVGEP